MIIKKQWNTIVGEVSEYTVEGLLSNHRYYARLYAYDREKGLRSEPTYSVTVRTKSSSEDYDSGQDIDDAITGDFVEKDEKITDRGMECKNYRC